MQMDGQDIDTLVANWLRFNNGTVHATAES
jgi:hypothetical protein